MNSERGELLMLPRWTVLNIGAITRNKFWGERESESYRHIYCTSTVIRTGAEVILVDPPMTGADMAYLLDSRCGLTFRDVTKVFITHTHGDHMQGLDEFPDAAWYMMPKELAAYSASSKNQQRAARVIPAGDEIAPGIKTIAIPGHTPGLGGLLFTAAEGTVVITGDGVMTRDFFRHRMGYYNSADPEAAAQSICHLATIADVIVPGHDNAFLVAAAQKDPLTEISYTK